MELLILTISSLGSLGVGFLIIRKRQKSWTHRLFLIFVFALILWSIANYFSLHSSFETTLFWIRLVMAFAVIQAITFLFFSINFPKTKFLISKRVTIGMLILGVLTIVVSLSPYLFQALTVKDGMIMPIPGIGMILFIPIAVGSIFAGFLILIRKYFHSQGYTKLQLQYLLFGTGVMFAMILIFKFAFVVFIKNSRFVALGPIFTLPFVAFTTYAILRHRLMNIRVFLRQSFIYAVSSGLVLAFLTFTALFVSRLIGNIFDVNFIVLASVFALLVAFLFYLLKPRVQKIADVLFFGKPSPHFQKELIEEFRRKLLENTMLQDFFKEAVSKFERNFSISSMNFLLTDFLDGNIETFYSTDKKIIKLDPDHPLIGYLKKDPKILVTERLPVSQTFDWESREVESYLASQNIAAVLPIVTNTRFLGIFLLTEKVQRRAWKPHEIRLLESFKDKFIADLSTLILYEQTMFRVRKMTEGQRGG